jgi:hypothetical protein
MVLDLEKVAKKLKPLCEWHEVPVTGKRFLPGSTGRFGFHIENVFGIPPNNSRKPDVQGHEFKSVLVTDGSVKPICIGTVPYQEYLDLANGNYTSFDLSEPAKKMAKALYIFYEKSFKQNAEIYRVLGFNHLELTNLNDSIKQELDSDFKILSDSFKKYNYIELSNSGVYHDYTTYLKLSYKGDSVYRYPCWSFKTAFVKKVYLDSAKNLKLLETV